MATVDRAAGGELHYEATPVVNDEARMADLPQGQTAPSEQEVPASLDHLLASHGSHARLDSRRYLRRPQWPRIVQSAHALAVGLLPLEIAGALERMPAVGVALVVGVGCWVAVAVSQRRTPGRFPLREMIAAVDDQRSGTWVALRSVTRTHG